MTVPLWSLLRQSGHVRDARAGPRVDLRVLLAARGQHAGRDVDVRVVLAGARVADAARPVTRHARGRVLRHAVRAPAVHRLQSPR